MLKVLIIKTSSMGDLIHTLPAITDAGRANPAIQFDWVAEQGFAEIPAWHRHVDKIIPIRFRHWRKQWFKSLKSGQIHDFLYELRKTRYDHIIDAQGLFKSLAITWLAKGKTRHGYDYPSAREHLTSYFYPNRHTASWELHAITRTRQLFASALGYTLPTTPPDFGLDRAKMTLPEVATQNPYFVFLHGTTWVTKHWPENYWQELVNMVTNAHYQVVLPWGNQAEKERAEKLAKGHDRVLVLPRLSIGEVGSIIANAKAVVSVDSGLGHLAAALSVPTVALYGPTDPNKIGTIGKNQIHLKDATFNCQSCDENNCCMQSTIKPACFVPITPQKVWENLQLLTSQEIAEKMNNEKLTTTIY